MKNDNTKGYSSFKPSTAYRNRWGKLRQIQITNSIMRDGKLQLSASALAVLIVLLNNQRNKNLNRRNRDLEPTATVKVGHKTLMERTGQSRNTISKAVKELKEKLYIQKIDKRRKMGEFGTSEFVLCNPQTGEPLSDTQYPYMGKTPAGYFTLPDCIVKATEYEWSLAQITPSELLLYVVLLYLANRARDNDFTTTAVEMRALSGLTPKTLDKAIDGLERRGLIWASSDSRCCTVRLCDPYTGAPIERYTGDDRDDPSNYYETEVDGRSKRLNLNTGDPAKIEKLLRSMLEGQQVIEHGKGELMICCPFHPDSTPSCSVTPQKNGCFRCFGCNAQGSLSKLVAQIRRISMGEAIEQTATALGKTAEFRDPDRRYEAIYDYCDAKGNLLKQVLRKVGKDGKKQFLQRRLSKKGGWIWNTKGMQPTLFHWEELEMAGVVCLVEGEKDAVTVSDLHLSGSGGLVIGMTSGSADSWDASLAKHLRGKRVVIMPDADMPGWNAAERWTASLDAEGIEHRKVDFSGTSAKDVTEYLETHSVAELVRLIGADWVSMPVGEPIESDAPVQEFLDFEHELAGGITI